MRRFVFFHKPRPRRKQLDWMALSYRSYCKRRGFEANPEDMELVVDYLLWVAKVQDLKLKEAESLW